MLVRALSGLSVSNVPSRSFRDLIGHSIRLRAGPFAHRTALPPSPHRPPPRSLRIYANPHLYTVFLCFMRENERGEVERKRRGRGGGWV